MEKVPQMGMEPCNECIASIHVFDVKFLLVVVVDYPKVFFYRLGWYLKLLQLAFWTYAAIRWGFDSRLPAWNTDLNARRIIMKKFLISLIIILAVRQAAFLFSYESFGSVGVNCMFSLVKRYSQKPAKKPNIFTSRYVDYLI